MTRNMQLYTAFSGGIQLPSTQLPAFTHNNPRNNTCYFLASPYNKSCIQAPTYSIKDGYSCSDIMHRYPTTLKTTLTLRSCNVSVHGHGNMDVGTLVLSCGIIRNMQQSFQNLQVAGCSLHGEGPLSSSLCTFCCVVGVYRHAATAVWVCDQCEACLGRF